jgi:hypothetical protein
VHETANWRIWEVRDALPPVEGPAELIAAGADGFDLEGTGTGDVLVRQHGTPYWEVATGDACVSEDPSGWTLVRVLRPGLIRVRARFSAAGALRKEPRCADDGDSSARTSAVSPPVTER